MKKKIFLAVIAIFVICLTCGMLFVACNDKEEKEEEIITDETTKQEDVFKDVVYALQDVRDDTTGNKEFNFALDIVDLEKDASVFTLATETIGGEDFFYGAIGSEMRKIKGFDLGGVIEEVLGWIGDSISVSLVTIDFDADGFLSGMVGGIVPSLLGDVAVSDNGEAYYLNLNILAVVDAIAGLGINFDTVIPAEYSWIIPTVVDVLGIDIPTEGDKAPGLMDVLNFIANNYAINFYFGFGANADTDKADTVDNKPFDNFEISDKIAAARKNMAAAGLISFQSEIKVDALEVAEDGGTAAEKVAASYVLDIDVDLDPFVLVRQHGDYEFGILSMLETSGTVAAGNFKIGFNDKTFKISDIMGMLDEAGYINISLDKVANGKAEKNLFTLYYDSRDGKVIASASVVNEVGLEGDENIPMAPYSIGGVYDLDALATIIDMLINADKYKETPSGSGAAEGEAEVKPCEGGKHTDGNKDCICDVCGTAIAHVDKDPEDNACDVCGAHVHGDRNPVDGVCDTEGCNEHLHYDKNKDGICDTAICKHIMDVMTLITTIFNDVKDANNGFYALAYDEDEELTSATVNFEKLAKYVVDKFVTLPAEDPKWPLIKMMIDVLPGQVLGGNALRVNIADISFAYGLAIDPEDYEAKSNLDFNLREDEALTGTADDNYVGTITNVAKDDNTAIKVGDTVTVTGTAIDGTTAVTTTGKVMAIYDGNYYVGIYTDLEPNLGNIFKVLAMLLSKDASEFEMGDNWPFYGVLTYTVPAQA